MSMRWIGCDGEARSHTATSCGSDVSVVHGPIEVELRSQETAVRAVVEIPHHRRRGRRATEVGPAASSKVSGSRSRTGRGSSSASVAIASCRPSGRNASFRSHDVSGGQRVGVCPRRTATPAAAPTATRPLSGFVSTVRNIPPAEVDPTSSGRRASAASRLARVSGELSRRTAASASRSARSASGTVARERRHSPGVGDGRRTIGRAGPAATPAARRRSPPTRRIASAREQHPQPPIDADLAPRLLLGTALLRPRERRTGLEERLLGRAQRRVSTVAPLDRLVQPKPPVQLAVRSAHRVPRVGRAGQVAEDPLAVDVVVEPAAQTWPGPGQRFVGQLDHVAVGGHQAGRDQLLDQPSRGRHRRPRRAAAHEHGPVHRSGSERRGGGGGRAGAAAVRRAAARRDPPRCGPPRRGRRRSCGSRRRSASGPRAPARSGAARGKAGGGLRVHLRPR